MSTSRSLSMSSTTTYHVLGKGINPTTLTRKHELFNSFVTTRNGFSNANLVQLVVVLGNAHGFTVWMQWCWWGTHCPWSREWSQGQNEEWRGSWRWPQDRTIWGRHHTSYVPGKFGKKGNFMCITMPLELRDGRFIVDPGSGHDLISVEKVERMDLNPYESNKINFHTANGVTSTTSMVDLDFDTATGEEMHGTRLLPVDVIPKWPSPLVRRSRWRSETWSLKST